MAYNSQVIRAQTSLGSQVQKLDLACSAQMPPERRKRPRIGGVKLLDT